MKSTIRKTAIGLLTLSLAALPLHSGAQATNKAPAKKPAVESREIKKARTLPFRGTLAAVDKTSRTLTVGKRVFHVTPETKVCKGPEKTPATLDEAVVGERITGSYQQSPEGKLTARSLYLDGKSGAEPGKKIKGEGEKGKQ